MWFRMEDMNRRVRVKGFCEGIGRPIWRRCGEEEEGSTKASTLEQQSAESIQHNSFIVLEFVMMTDRCRSQDALKDVPREEDVRQRVRRMES